MGKISAEDFITGWVGPIPSSIDNLKRIGIRTISVPEVSDRPRNCHKINLVRRIVEENLLQGKSHLLLLDCDVAFAGVLNSSVFHDNQISGRIVGYPNPPMLVWRELFAKSSVCTLGSDGP